jgi:hypothetical protein
MQFQQVARLILDVVSGSVEWNFAGISVAGWGEERNSGRQYILITGERYVWNSYN